MFQDIEGPEQIECRAEGHVAGIDLNQFHIRGQLFRARTRPLGWISVPMTYSQFRWTASAPRTLPVPATNLDQATRIREVTIGKGLDQPTSRCKPEVISLHLAQEVEIGRIESGDRIGQGRFGQSYPVPQRRHMRAGWAGPVEWPNLSTAAY